MSTLRRIPIDSNFMKGNINISRSKPNDVLYGYLQLVSTYCKTTQRRFIYTSTYSHVKVEQYFGNSENGKPRFPRKNVERAFKVLLDYGYISKSKIVGLKGNVVNIYELPYKEDEPFQYIELDILEKIVKECSLNLLKLYIYLKQSYNNFNTPLFTYKLLLKECFALASSKNKKSMDELKNKLNILKQLDLIKYCEFSMINETGKPVPYKRLIDVK